MRINQLVFSLSNFNLATFIMDDINVTKPVSPRKVPANKVLKFYGQKNYNFCGYIL